MRYWITLLLCGWATCAMALHEPVRVIGNLVVPDDPEYISEIVDELKEWQAAGYTAVLYSYYGELVYKVTPVLEAVKALGLDVIFAYSETCMVNDDMTWHEPRWRDCAWGTPGPPHQAVAMACAPYVDALVLHWQGSSLIERASYEGNTNVVSDTVSEQKAVSDARVQSWLKENPDCEIWGAVDVHYQPGANDLQWWCPDYCDRVLITGLSHHGRRGVTQTGAGFRRFAASVTKRDLPVVLGPVTVAAYWRTWAVGEKAHPHYKVPERYCFGHAPRSDKVWSVYKDNVLLGSVERFDLAIARVVADAHDKDRIKAEYWASRAVMDELKTGTNRAAWQEAKIVNRARRIALTNMQSKVVRDAAAVRTLHNSQSAARLASSQYADKYAINKKVEQFHRIPVSFSTNLQGHAYDVVWLDGKSLSEWFPLPARAALRNVHEDTEAYADWLIQTGASGIIRLVGDCAGEKLGNSDQIGYHDYDWFRPVVPGGAIPR